MAIWRFSAPPSISGVYPCLVHYNDGDSGNTTPMRAPGAADHAGADPGPAFGLLLLRLVVGGIFIAHGLEKFFTWAGTPGLDGFADSLADMGFTNTSALAMTTAITEIVAGALLVIGLLASLASVPLLGLAVASVVFTFDEGFFLTPDGGFEYKLLLAAAAAALVFTGPGRFSLDSGRPYFRFPFRTALVFLVLGGIATAVVLFVFR